MGREASTRVKILLTGCGYWGEKLGEKLSKLVDTVGFYDSDRAKALSLCKQVETEKTKYVVYHFPQELLGFDAVAIAAPSAAHYEIAKTCLEAGKHVLVEKPMTLDYSQAVELDFVQCPRFLAWRLPFGLLSPSSDFVRFHYP